MAYTRHNNITTYLDILEVIRVANIGGTLVGIDTVTLHVVNNLNLNYHKHGVLGFWGEWP